MQKSAHPTLCNMLHPWTFICETVVAFCSVSYVNYCNGKTVMDEVSYNNYYQYSKPYHVIDIII